MREAARASLALNVANLVGQVEAFALYPMCFPNPRFMALSPLSSWRV
jgi:hypothetical protein